jgi:hypothetical protein
MTTPSNQQKWKYTLYTSLVFIVITNPIMYKITTQLLKPIFKVSMNGSPTIYGLSLHTVIFTLIVRYMMDLNI